MDLDDGEESASNWRPTFRSSADQLASSWDTSSAHLVSHAWNSSSHLQLHRQNHHHQQPQYQPVHRQLPSLKVFPVKESHHHHHGPYATNSHSARQRGRSRAHLRLQDSFENYAASLGSDPEFYEERMSDIVDIAERLGDYAEITSEEKERRRISESKWIFDSEKGWVPNPSASPIPLGPVKSSSYNDLLAYEHPSKGIGAKITAALGGDVITVVGNQTGSEPLDTGSGPPPPPAPEFPPMKMDSASPSRSPSVTKTKLKRSSPVSASMQPNIRQDSLTNSQRQPPINVRKRVELVDDTLQLNPRQKVRDAEPTLAISERRNQTRTAAVITVTPFRRRLPVLQPDMQANKSFSHQHPARTGRALPQIPPKSHAFQREPMQQQQQHYQQQPPQQVHMQPQNVSAASHTSQQNNQQLFQNAAPPTVQKQQLQYPPQQPLFQIQTQPQPQSVLRQDGKRDSEPKSVSFSDQNQSRTYSDSIAMLNNNTTTDQTAAHTLQTSRMTTTSTTRSHVVSSTMDASKQPATLPVTTMSATNNFHPQVLPSVQKDPLAIDSKISTSSDSSMPVTTRAPAFDGSGSTNEQTDSQHHSGQQLHHQHEMLDEPHDGGKEHFRRDSDQRNDQQQTVQVENVNQSQRGRTASEEEKAARERTGTGSALDEYAPSDLEGLSAARILWMSAFNKIIAQWNEASFSFEFFFRAAACRPCCLSSVFEFVLSKFSSEMMSSLETNLSSVPESLECSQLDR
ncbi:hypothetical protein HDE_03100 [Halotydeus destructor]|nr:hypothetical protein HDE_03100 [Halotydeus destructor]